MDIQKWAGEIENATFGCKASCKLHAQSRARVEGVLRLFVGELLDGFEIAHFGDPLPEEQRSWAEYAEATK